MGGFVPVTEPLDTGPGNGSRAWIRAWDLGFGRVSGLGRTWIYDSLWGMISTMGLIFIFSLLTINFNP